MGDFNEFIQGRSQLYDTYALITKNIEVTFFSTKYPQDVETSVDIYNRMVYKENVKIIEKNL